MKKAAAFILAVLMLFLTMTGAHAEEKPYKTENGFAFRTETTPDGEVLRDVTLLTWLNTVYVPKTLGGIALTPDVLDGTTFYAVQWHRITEFTVDEDNPWFTVRNCALYTKDGKTAVAFPNAKLHNIYTIPDGTQTIGSCSLCDPWECCIVLPDSVTTIADDAILSTDPEIDTGLQIAAASGSAAEAYAAKIHCPFIPMGEGHIHTYFMERQAPTCISAGCKTVLCPCGDIYAVETLPPDPDAHNWQYIENDDRDEWVCKDCGVLWTGRSDCTCLCHKASRYTPVILKLFSKESIHTLLYCFTLFFWRLTGTHQYCTCGTRHY